MNIPIIKLNDALSERLRRRIETLPKGISQKFQMVFDSVQLIYERAETDVVIIEAKDDKPLTIRYKMDTPRGPHEVIATLNYYPEDSIREHSPYMFKREHYENGVYLGTGEELGFEREDLIFTNILDDFIHILIAASFPEEGFDTNPITKKHRIKPRKSWEKGGNDEALYTVLKSYESHKGTVKATGTGTPHSHEYGVRGFWRHYKSGKETWVKPHQRCVGRGVENQHEYLIADKAMIYE